jgi:hypothetical protein
MNSFVNPRDQERQALRQLLLEMVDRLGKPAGRGVDLASIPLADLVEAIVAARGERSAAWLRTRLHQRLEGRRGRRSPGGGADRIAHANGSNGRHVDADGIERTTP